MGLFQVVPAQSLRDEFAKLLSVFQIIQLFPKPVEQGRHPVERHSSPANAGEISGSHLRYHLR
jgi:hypothetical protein